MKHLVTFYMKQANILDKVNTIKQELKVDPLDFEALSYRNLGQWYSHTMMWLYVLQSDYFSKRIQSIREKTPDYQPQMLDFLPIFYIDLETSLAILKTLDDLCLQATQTHFPDPFLIATQPPNMGPYFDLLTKICQQQGSIPIDLLHPIFLNLGLRFSSKRKDMTTLSNITKNDIQFLAQFVMYLAKHPLCPKILSYADSDEVFPIIVLNITPEEKMGYLDFQEHLIEDRLSEVQKALEAYEKNSTSSL